MPRSPSPVPQPYPRHLLPEVTVDTAAVMQARGECFARGMQAISQHSMAEAMVSDVLTAMLHADPAPAAAIYGTIRNGRLQRDALMAVALTKGTPLLGINNSTVLAGQGA